MYKKVIAILIIMSIFMVGCGKGEEVETIEPYNKVESNEVLI